MTKQNETKRVNGNDVALRGYTINYAYIDKADEDGIYRCKLLDISEDDQKQLNAAINLLLDANAQDLDIEPDVTAINCKTQYLPALGVRQNGKTDNYEFYSGCVCDVVVSPYLYTYKRRTGVAWCLKAMLKTSEGERLDGRKTVFDYFGDECVSVNREVSADEAEPF